MVTLTVVIDDIEIPGRLAVPFNIHLPTAPLVGETIKISKTAMTAQTIERFEELYPIYLYKGWTRVCVNKISHEANANLGSTILHTNFLKESTLV